MLSNFEDLKGKIINKIDLVESDDGDKLLFYTDKNIYEMYHDQDCGESVDIEDIVGDLDDLIGVPVLNAYVSTKKSDSNPDRDFKDLWTFYNISTIKGSVTFRWYGESNGCYSVEVSFYKKAV